MNLMNRPFRSGICFLLVIGFGFHGSLAHAFDDVRVAVPNRVSVHDLSGRILDWTEQELVLERITPAGTSRIPTPHVADIRYEVLPEHQQAEIELVLGNRQKALELFSQALDQDPRGWVQRELLARMIILTTKQKAWKQAGTYYRKLLQSHEIPRHQETIPLLWMADQVPGAIQFQTGQSFLQDELAAVQLIGCSLLIPIDREIPKALEERLNHIGTAESKIIRVLSRAMKARGRLSSPELSEAEVVSWERFLKDLPTPWQHGPRLVLAQGYLRVDQPGKALQQASWVVANSASETLHHYWGSELVDQALSQLQQ